MTCSIEGCNEPVYIVKRGWCKTHYNRWYRHGDPMVTKSARKQKRAACRKPVRKECPAEGWRDEAACLGMDMDPARQTDREALLAVCNKCPVLDDCFTWMKTSRLYQATPGVLAGTLPEDRYRDEEHRMSELNRYDTTLTLFRGVSDELLVS